MAQDNSMLDGTIASVDASIRSLNLEDDMRAVLVEPWREIQVALPVLMDDGNVRVFRGYRSQHNARSGALQEGDQVPPQRRSQSRSRPRYVDDVEDGTGRCPVRWRKRWSVGRPERTVDARAEPADPALHNEHAPRIGREQGYSRPRPGHFCSNDGPDHRCLWFD